MNRYATCILTLLTAALIAGCGGQRPTDSMLERGDMYYALGNYAEASEEYALAVDRQPGNAHGHAMLGRALLKLDRPQDARRHLEIAHTLRRRDQAIADDLAEAYFRTDDATRLFGFLRDRAENERSVHSYLLLARYAEELDDPDSARRAVQTAIILDLESEEGPSIEPYIIAADLALRVGDMDEAVRRLRQALSINAGDERVRERLRNLDEVPGPSIALEPGR
jgi:tetratricopeptide (TPR) repeat protein